MNQGFSIRTPVIAALNRHSLPTASGSQYHAVLAARLDIDLRRPAFWEGSLNTVEKRVEQFLKL